MWCCFWWTLQDRRSYGEQWRFGIVRDWEELWWIWTLSCRCRDSKIKEDTERRWGIVPWTRSESPKSPWEALREGLTSVAVETTTYQRCQDHGKTSKDSSRFKAELAQHVRQAVCVLWTAEMEKWTCQALWRPENHERISDSGNSDICSVGVWFWLSVVLLMPCFFHFGIRNCLSCFWFYRNLQVRAFG